MQLACSRPSKSRQFWAALTTALGSVVQQLADEREHMFKKTEFTCMDMTDKDDFAMNLGISLIGQMVLALNRRVTDEMLGHMSGPDHLISIVMTWRALTAQKHCFLEPLVGSKAWQSCVLGRRATCYSKQWRLRQSPQPPSGIAGGHGQEQRGFQVYHPEEFGVGADPQHG